MPLKSELLNFLSRIPNIETVPQRKALLATLGFDRLESQISYEGIKPVFFNGLIEQLRSEGQANLVSFLRNLVESGWIGFDDRLTLTAHADSVQALTSEKWKQEFWGVSNTESSSHIPFFLPQSDTRNFTGREEQLQQLEALLLNSQDFKVCSIVGVSGGGGIGKSALACHFATIHKYKFPDGVIGLRVDGKDVDTIAREFVRSCGEELDSEDDRDAATLMQQVFAHRQMLLIFDNAEEAIIKKLRPGGTCCAVIVTTRRRNLLFSLDIAEQQTIDLPPLPEADALKLLKKILGSERVENAVVATRRLVKLVGNLPLALQVLGAALRGQREPLDDYTKALEEEKEELFEELKIEGDRELNVELSLNVSLKSLSEDEVDFFACLSVCAAEGFTKQTAMAATGCQKNLQAQRWLKKLYDLSLSNYVDTGENRFVLHPLVREYAEALARKRELLAVAQERHAKFFVEWLQSDELTDETTIAKVAANLDDVILAVQWLQSREADTEQSKIETYQFALKLQPLFEQYGYWQKAITLMARFQLWAEQFEDWNAVVRYKTHEARYCSFAEEFERAEEILHSAHTDIQKIENIDNQKRRKAMLLSVLAGVLQKQSKIEEAVQTFREEIRIREETGNGRSLSIAYNRLGKLLQSQDNFEEAQQVFERSITVSVIMNNPLGIAIGFNCLERLLGHQNKGIQQYLQKKISIAEGINDQSQLGMWLSLLGRFLQGQGHLEEAQHYFERRIEITKFISQNSDVVDDLYRLGSLFKQQDKFEEARQAIEQGIELAEAIRQTSQAIRGSQNLGSLLAEQGKFEEARQAIERGIELAEATRQTSQAISGSQNLGSLFKQQGKFEEARQTIERGIELAEATHQTSQAINGSQNLGSLFKQQGKFEEARQTIDRGIELAEAISEKSYVINGLYQIGSLFKQQGKFEEARQTIERGIELAEAISENSHAVNGLYQIGTLFKQQGKLKEAQQAIDRGIKLAQAIRQTSLVIHGLTSLRRLFQQQGKLEEALAIARCCVALETELGVSRGLIIALTQVIHLLKASRQVQEAITTLEHIAQIEEELGNPQNLARTLSSLASLQREHGYFDEASNTLLRIFDIEKGLNNHKRMFWTLAKLGYVALYQEKFDLAIEYYDRAVTLSKNSGSEQSLASIMNGMGVGLYEYGNLILDKKIHIDKAIEVLERSQEIFTYLNISTQIAWVLHSLGRAWKLKGNFEKAEILLKKSQEIFEDEKDLPGLAKVMNTLGGVLDKQQKWDESEKILRQSYDLAVKLEDKRGQAIIANSLGQVIAKKKGEETFELSQMFFRQSIKLGEELNEQQHLAKTHTAMGNVFLAHEFFEQDVYGLSKAFEIDENLSNVHGLKIITPKLTYALTKLEKHKEALEYCDRALKFYPNYSGFIQLREKIKLVISTGIQQTFIKTGLILYIRQNKEDNSRWGKVVPNDGSQNIIFYEEFIGSESISKLIQGALVEVEVKEKYGRLYARKIKVI